MTSQLAGEFCQSLREQKLKHGCVQAADANIAPVYLTQDPLVLSVRGRIAEIYRCTASAAAAPAAAAAQAQKQALIIMHQLVQNVPAVAPAQSSQRCRGTNGEHYWNPESTDDSEHAAADLMHKLMRRGGLHHVKGKAAAPPPLRTAGRPA